MSPLFADPVVLVGTGLLLILLVAGVTAFVIHRKRRRKDTDGRLREACRGVLANFVIPDGNGGEIQVQYALLSSRGITVVDVKDVEGHVFGSEAMQDWTVIATNRRFTFGNPQPGLWDRVAAIKRLVPEVPVSGYVAFTEHAVFTKGRPRSVIMLENLLQDLEKERSQKSAGAEVFVPYWERVREAAISARMDHLLRAKDVTAGG